MFLRHHSEEVPSPVVPEDADSELPCNFQPKVVVIVGLMAALLCLTFFAMLYAHTCGKFASRLFRRRSGGGISNNLQVTNISSASRNVTTGGYSSLMGVSQSVLEALPSLRFSEVGGLKQGMECAVCLGRYQENDLLRLLPRCRHAFHVPCIDKWLFSRSSCPLCRSLVSSEDVANIKDLLSNSNGGGGGDILQVVIDPPDHQKLSSNPAASWRLVPAGDAHFVGSEDPSELNMSASGSAASTSVL